MYVKQLITLVLGFRVAKTLCSYCTRAFSRKDHLQRHIREIHFFHRNFKCDQCKKSFKRKAHLLKHLASDCHGNAFKRS